MVEANTPLISRLGMTFEAMIYCPSSSLDQQRGNTFSSVLEIDAYYNSFVSLLVSDNRLITVLMRHWNDKSLLLKQKWFFTV